MPHSPRKKPYFRPPRFGPLTSKGLPAPISIPTRPIPAISEPQSPHSLWKLVNGINPRAHAKSIRMTLKIVLWQTPNNPNYQAVASQAHQARATDTTRWISPKLAHEVLQLVADPPLLRKLMQDYSRTMQKMAQDRIKRRSKPPKQ